MAAGAGGRETIDAGCCSLNVELLEERHLLSASIGSLEWARELIDDRVTGATIITHGFQPPEPFTQEDPLLSLAQAIRTRADNSTPLLNDAWFLDYDVPGEGGIGAFDVGAESESILTGLESAPGVELNDGHLVLLFDWAPESQEFSAGWGEAAGDALFSLVVGLGLADPLTGAGNAQEGDIFELTDPPIDPGDSTLNWCTRSSRTPTVPSRKSRSTPHITSTCCFSATRPGWRGSRSGRPTHWARSPTRCFG
jgi:hypothetical protein